MSQAGIVEIENANPQILTSVTTNSGTAIPIANNMEILGVTVANATFATPLFTTGSGKTVNVNVQVGKAIASAPANKNDAGLVSFDSTQFTVDTHGFVQFIGSVSAVGSFNIDTSTPPGTDPVGPNVLGIVNITGGQASAGSIPNIIRTNSLAANSYTIEIQRSSEQVSSLLEANGVCHFDSSQFSVDNNGFVTLQGAGTGIDSVAVQTGTSPIVPTVAGLITINGGVVSAGTNPVRSNGTGANTLALEVQISQALAAADATKIGLSNFDSTSFAVDANGFVTLSGGGFTWNDVSGAFSPLKNNGYFSILTATGSLPAGAAQGDTIKFFVDHATQDLTIDAAGTDLIRIGSLVSSAGGQALSTQQGDSLTLVYRASDTQWCAIEVIGTWVLS